MECMMTVRLNNSNFSKGYCDAAEGRSRQGSSGNILRTPRNTAVRGVCGRTSTVCFWNLGNFSQRQEEIMICVKRVTTNNDQVIMCI